MALLFYSPNFEYLQYMAGFETLNYLRYRSFQKGKSFFTGFALFDFLMDFT